MMIWQLVRIVFKKISSDDDSLGYDDARTREIQEIISDEDSVGFSLSDTPSGGGRSGVAISLRILSACWWVRKAIFSLS